MNVDPPAELLDDAKGYGQPESGAVVALGTEERFEDMVDVFLGDSGTIVADGHGHHVVTFLLQGNFDTSAIVWYNRESVGQNVQEHLL